ncbi:MAG: endonuclease III [Syntrophus sp. (in: bacteria)]|nr:endonuclease III [Syntrophus sp. (in: bacteria)]
MMDILKKYLKNNVPVITKLSQKERNPFLVLVGTLLSLRTKDETTEKAMERLMARAKTPEEILGLSDKELQGLIYPVGFYRNKAQTLKDVSQIIIGKYSGMVPDTIDELLTIKGVGRKTANLVLNEGYGKLGICVDVHVHRISNRIGLVDTRNPHETEDALRRLLPEKYWIVYNTLLVAFGQRLCKPVSPMCNICPIAHLCPQIGVIKHR